MAYQEFDPALTLPVNFTVRDNPFENSKQKYPKQHYNERYAPDSKGSEVFTNRARGGANSKTPYVNTLRTSDILKHDKDEKLIPIRECFVNAEVVTTAFASGKNTNGNSYFWHIKE